MALRTNPHKQTHFDPNIYDDKCVSEICECGSHKCPPPDLNKAVKFQKPILAAQTQGKCRCKCKKPKKKCNCKCSHPHQIKQHVYQQRHYDPTSIQSTYQVDFKGKYVEQDPLRRTNGHGHTAVFHQGGHAPFISSTQYNTQFTGKLVQRDYLSKSAQIFRPVPDRPPFDGTTTYNMSYQGKLVQKQGPVGTKVIIERPYVPFDGTTQYNAKYQYVAVERGDCESCCGCESQQCSSCCDCDADSLDQYDHHNQQNNQSNYKQTVPVYPSFTKQTSKDPKQQPNTQLPLQKTKQNAQCPIKKLPQVPKRALSGQPHTKFQAKKNIWK